MTHVEDGRHVWTPTTRERLAYRVAGLILMAAVAFMGLILFWLVFPGKGFEDVQFSVPKTVQAGTIMRYQVNYCQGGLAETPVLVLRELELQDHGTNIQLPGLAYTTKANCEVLDRAVGIPSFTPPGPYRLMVTTELQANPIRHVRQVWLSPEITVTK